MTPVVGNRRLILVLAIIGALMWGGLLAHCVAPGAGARTVTTVLFAASEPGTWHGISWYCWPPAHSRCTRGVPWTSMAAAYGPRSGFHMGDRLRLTYRGRSVVVTIRDYCPSCGGGLDVYGAAFSRLAPLSAGRISVQVRRVP
jgi:hypothetical protein